MMALPASPMGAYMAMSEAGRLPRQQMLFYKLANIFFGEHLAGILEIS
jgi:hypothetical protein